MGNVNGKANNTRSEEERCYSYPYSRGSADVRFQGASFRNQPERINRALSTESRFSNSRTAASGGILLQLIEEAQNQITVRESEVSQLRNHIQKLQILLGQLEQSE